MDNHDYINFMFAGCRWGEEAFVARPRGGKRGRNRYMATPLVILPECIRPAAGIFQRSISASWAGA